MAAPHVAGAFAITQASCTGCNRDGRSGRPPADRSSDRRHATGRHGDQAADPRGRVRWRCLLPDRPLVDSVTPDRGAPGETLSVSVAGAELPGGGAAQRRRWDRCQRGDRRPAQPDQRHAGGGGRGGAWQARRDGHQPGRPDGRSRAAHSRLRRRRRRSRSPTWASCATGSAEAPARSPPTAPPTAPSPSTLGTGAGNRTLTQLELRRTDNAGVWDTVPSTANWALGAANGLDAPLANTSNGTLTLPLTEGQTTHLFAGDSTSNSFFASGTTFRLTATFSDGSTATTQTTLAAGPPTLTAVGSQHGDSWGRRCRVSVAGGQLPERGRKLSVGDGISCQRGDRRSPPSQISATLAVAAGAALGKRDVTVTNPRRPDGASRATHSRLRRRHRRSRSPTWASCATGSAEAPARSPPTAPSTAPSP